MLPNDHHPGPGCSCSECLREFPEVCSRCGGTKLVTISYGGDGYGDKCCAMADADDQPCPDCEEAREEARIERERNREEMRDGSHYSGVSRYGEL